MIVNIMIIALNAAWTIVCYCVVKAGYKKGVNDAKIEFLKEVRQQQRYTIFGKFSKPSQSTIEVETRFRNDTMDSIPAEVISRTAQRELAEEMIKQLEDYVHIEQDNHTTTFSLNLLVADKGEI